MRLKRFFMILCILLSLTTKILADDNKVATVVLLRGNVKATTPDGKEFDLKADQSITKGTQVITSAKSFVKLAFIDKSTINLGPSSSMFIQAFAKSEAGIIKLIRGQIRAEVTKNYMEIDDKSKSKLYIQTKTSAMGIRGTDFQVNYNPINQNSSLIVFEGKVAMAHIDRAIQNEVLVQNKLEMLVSNNTAVLVTQGQISAVNLNISDRALVPTKLAPKQLDALRENPSGLLEDTKNKKRFRDIIPPGVDGAVFINTSPDIQKAEVSAAKSFFNDKTHEYKPAAGTIIDLKTVNIISPPPEAPFDHATKTFVITENLGKIDAKSGQFKAPQGYELSNEGQFQPVIKDNIKNPNPNRIDQRIEGVRVDIKEDGNVTAPATTAPAPTAPAPKAPLPTAPLPTAPLPTAPLPTAPLPTAPLPTAPLPTAPLPTAPLPTAPLPTAPLPTAPLPTAPLPTAPLPPKI